MNKIEIKKSKIDFTYLWKIKDIDVNIVTFVKYQISAPVDSINSPNKSIITLKEPIGSETHKVVPDVQFKLCGKVGEIIKGFDVRKFNNSIKVENIIWL